MKSGDDHFSMSNQLASSNKTPTIFKESLLLQTSYVQNSCQDIDSSDTDDSNTVPENFKSGRLITKQTVDNSRVPKIPDQNNIFKPDLQTKSTCKRCKWHFSPKFHRMFDEFPQIKMYNDMITDIHYSDGVYDENGCAKHQSKHAGECGICLEKITKENREL